jgi:Tol biopolymer transport system component
VVGRPERGGRGRSGGGRRLILAGALLAAFSLLLPPPAGQVVAAPSTPHGTIVAPRGSGLVMVDAATGAERQVAVTPSIGVTGHAAWSPDGSRVALSRFGRRPGERIGGSDILVVPADGGPAWAAAEHDAEGVLLRAPAWAHDGSGLYYDYLPQDAGPQSSRVEFATSSGTGAWIVAGAAAWPDISPDGRWLAYARPSSEEADFDELVLQSLETGSSTVVVAGGQFVQLICPRFAPDGSRIAFIGATSRGEEETATAPAPGSLASRLWAAPRAHGPPGDAYLVALDGSGLTRRTDFAEDEPTLAWSPDGAWLAILAGGGLYLVEADGSQPPAVLAPGSFGGIDWR